MAMYEYRCRDCGRLSEHLSWGAAAAERRCGCGSAALERVWYSRFAVAGGGNAFAEAGAAGGDEAGADGCCGGGACGADACGWGDEA
ncbi:MAG: FmdB family zinc ribbon protein [Terriglobales bacterium]